MLAHLFVLILPLTIITSAQDFTIPTEWTDTRSPVPREQRVKAAQNVLDSLSSFRDPVSGRIRTTAKHDMLSSTTDSHSSMLSDFAKIMPSILPKTINAATTLDTLIWGFPAIYGYRTYRDQAFMKDAVRIWEAIEPWRITEVSASNGSHPLKSAPFRSECNNSSVAGGIFWNVTSKTDVGVGAGSQGAYIALSAYLYEATKNQTYLDAAISSQRFIQTQLVDATTGLVRDIINLGNCNYRNQLVLTYNTGLYIEAVSVLGNLTGDKDMTTAADQISRNAMKSSGWPNPNGILAGPAMGGPNSPDGSTTWKGTLIRGLHEHWSRSQPDSDIARLIEAFILIQFNSLINSAKSPNGPWYSPSWTGPPPSSPTPWGQQGAIDVLNSVIDLHVDSPDSSGHRRSSIIAGVLGGVISLILVIVALFVFLRRRKGLFSRRGSAPTALDITGSETSETPRSLHQDTPTSAHAGMGAQTIPRVDPYTIETSVSLPSRPAHKSMPTAPPRYEEVIGR